jgi:hypothetical protein
MTTNLWTVGQGLITRRLMPKPGSAPVRTGPKRSSRTAPAPAVVSENGKAETPKQQTPPPSGPRRVKKKGGGRR